MNRPSDLWAITWHTIIHEGMPKGKQENGQLLKDIVGENIPKLVKD